MCLRASRDKSPRERPVIRLDGQPQVGLTFLFFQDPTLPFRRTVAHASPATDRVNKLAILIRTMSYLQYDLGYLEARLAQSDVWHIGDLNVGGGRHFLAVESKVEVKCEGDFDGDES